jgi:hypothetical protein
MRKLARLLSILVLTAAAIAHAATTVAVTGHVGDIAGNPTQLVQVKFDLAYCGGNIPRVVGQFSPVRSTVTLTPDTTGLITGTLWPNDVIECGTVTGGTRYNVTFLYNNIPSGQPVCFDILSTVNPFNLDTAQPCATLPVPVPPTGPQDAAVNNLTVSGLLSGGNANFTGTVSANQFDGTFYGSVLGGEVYGNPLLGTGYYNSINGNITQMGWNQLGGGEGDFFDQHGTGGGGFDWFAIGGTNFNGNPGSPIMTLSASGQLSLPISVTAPNFYGALNGNATSATTAATATNATTASSVPAAGITGSITNGQLAHSSTTVNGTNCALGGTCTITFPHNVVAVANFTSCALIHYGDTDQNCAGTQTWSNTISGSYTPVCTLQFPFMGGTNDSTGMTQTTFGLNSTSSTGFGYYIANIHDGAAGNTVTITCAALQ